MVFYLYKHHTRELWEKKKKNALDVTCISEKNQNVLLQ